MWYRGIRFTKNFIGRYLTYIFYAHEKGDILFTDGTKSLEFSSRPQIVKRASWTARELPAILIGKVRGGTKYVSFTKDKLRVQAADEGDNVYEYHTVGGNFDLRVELAVRASTVEERDNLVDITAVYLSHPDAKDYFHKHYLLLPDPPTISGERDILEPKIDHPIYETAMELRVLTRWQEFSKTQRYRLLNIITSLEDYPLDEIAPGFTYMRDPTE
jgi:hypothetical protein